MKRMTELKGCQTFPMLGALGIFVVLGLSGCRSDRGASLEVISQRGVTASDDSLFEALKQVDLPLAGALVRLNYGAGARDAEGRTPLMLAAGGEASFLVASLLANGADPNAIDRSGRTALTAAIENGRLDAVVSLLKAGASPRGRQGLEEDLVARALRLDHIAAARLLLEAGAHPNARDGDRKSLIRIAVEKRQDLIFDDLLKKGVNLDDDVGAMAEDRPPLTHLALEMGRESVLLRLLEEGMSPEEANSKGETLLYAAAKSAKVDLFHRLKDHGASFDVVGPDGLRPLHHAILAKNEAVLKELLRLGAKVNLPSQQEDKSISPLPLALREGDLKVAKLLLAAGAEPLDELYESVALGGENGLARVKLLLEAGAGASPDRGESPDSPIALAVRHGELEMVRSLLAAGAPHGQLDPCGQKILHLAVAQGDVAIAALLLENGADANDPFLEDPSEEFLKRIQTEGVIRWALKNSKMITPIMLASDAGNVKMAQTLIAHGASTKKSTKVGETRMWPLTFATRRSDTDMTQVMLGRTPGRTELWIKVDLSEQRAYVYQGAKEIYKTKVSTGKKGHRTPQGTFVITNKYREWESTIYESSMPYFQRLSASDFGFHVGYVPGYAASHGCIRMPSHAAIKLFTMTQVGDYVEIVP